MNSILAIGAHPGDLELGCGATLAKLSAAGIHVRALVLSDGLHGARRADDRCAETRLALRLLGVSDVVQGDLPDTHLPSFVPRIVRMIESHCAEMLPDRVYTMLGDDRHQDHRAVHAASIVACRAVPQVLSYDTPSSWPNFVPTVFEPIERFLDRKVAAIRCHRSQHHRDYMQEAHVRCNAQFRGQQVGVGPSEGFIAYKWVL